VADGFSLDDDPATEVVAVMVWAAKMDARVRPSRLLAPQEPKYA
jgi:hypothetical protein